MLAHRHQKAVRLIAAVCIAALLPRVVIVKGTPQKSCSCCFVSVACMLLSVTHIATQQLVTFHSPHCPMVTYKSLASAF